MSRLGVIRGAVVNRVIAAAIVSVASTACSKDSSSTTAPVVSRATSIVVSGGGSQSAVVATALANPIAVTVTDQNGKPMANVPVSFTSTQASVAAQVAVTDASGVAQIEWTLGTKAGVDSMTATIADQGISTTVVATALPDAPANMTVVGGNAQNAPAGSALGAALAVQVTDRFGNPVAGVPVQWSDDAGGSLASTSVVTDANGIAQDSLTLPASAGKDDVTAEVVLNGTPAIEVTFTEQAS